MLNFGHLLIMSRIRFSASSRTDGPVAYIFGKFGWASSIAFRHRSSSSSEPDDSYSRILITAPSPSSPNSVL
jgi:hypothetical protein